MQLQLQLAFTGRAPLLTFNYPYPLSAAIYKIIQRADEGYAAFLHGEGYRLNGKTFKLFTFSDLRVPFTRNGNFMRLEGTTAELTVCFYLPGAAETFIKGLFMHQQLEVANRETKVRFAVTGVESLFAEPKKGRPLLLQVLSPVVTGPKDRAGHYTYLPPGHPDFTYWLKHNLLQKYAAVHTVTEEELKALGDSMMLTVQPSKQEPQQRLIRIKEGTAEETKIKGFTRFGLLLDAPAAVAELALGAGMGLYNAMGMGCVGIIS